jgi:DNA-binding MarR family transcriptional regulator
MKPRETEHHTSKLLTNFPIKNENTMITTLEDIVALHHARLNTLTRKLIYLIIRNGYKEDGWTTISVAEFGKATALTRRAVDYILKDLLDAGVIERRKSSESHTAPYQYKTLEI